MMAVSITIDGTPHEAREGDSVAAVLMNAGVRAFRESRSGAPRGPLCAMGTCYECRVTIDGVGQQRACMRDVAAGMDVRTSAVSTP